LNLPAIRRAVAGQLQDASVVAGLNVYAYPPARVALPALLVLPDPGAYVAYHRTFEQPIGEVQLVVRAILPASATGQVQAFEQMDLLLSSGTDEGASIVDVLMADKTLGGVVDDCLPQDARNWLVGELMVGDVSTPVVSCDVPLIIRARRV
jgi:hypothetical protein